MASTRRTSLHGWCTFITHGVSPIFTCVLFEAIKNIVKTCQRLSDAMMFVLIFVFAYALLLFFDVFLLIYSVQMTTVLKIGKLFVGLSFALRIG